MMSPPLNVTELLVRADAGDEGAQADLYALVEPVLRNLARARKRANPAGHELRTTVLIDDAFVKLVGRRVTVWSPGDRQKFFAYASKKMQDMLIVELRRGSAIKRNEGQALAPLEEALVVISQSAGGEDLDFQLDLKDKLAQLQELDEEAAIIFRIKYFWSATFDDVVEMLGFPNRSAVVKPYARAIVWLRNALRDYDLES
jgi:RNA polymerase sigma factor (TIGR02999 family)